MCKMTCDAHAMWPVSKPSGIGRYAIGHRVRDESYGDSLSNYVRRPAGERLMWRLSGKIPVSECLELLRIYEGVRIEAVVNVTRYDPQGRLVGLLGCGPGLIPAARSYPIAQ